MPRVKQGGRPKRRTAYKGNDFVTDPQVDQAAHQLKIDYLMSQCGTESILKCPEKHLFVGGGDLFSTAPDEERSTWPVDVFEFLTRNHPEWQVVFLIWTRREVSRSLKSVSTTPEIRAWLLESSLTEWGQICSTLSGPIDNREEMLELCATVVARKEFQEFCRDTRYSNIGEILVQAFGNNAWPYHSVIEARIRPPRP